MNEPIPNPLGLSSLTGVYTWTTSAPSPPPSPPRPDHKPPSPVQPKLPAKLALSVRDAAELLGVSQRTVRRLIDRRLIRPSKALRHILIPHWELERFLRDTAAFD